MPNAEIIAIGTELLLGEIVDTNSAHIARRLRTVGLDLYWISAVGDNRDRIAQAVSRGLERSDAVITTGGLGPTVDDPTREAIAQAVGRPLEFREDLWAQIQERFARWGRAPTENNRRQAFVPAGAIAIENPVGTAPAFIVETERSAVVCLPGVPREMEHLLETRAIPYLRQRLMLDGVIKARLLHTAGWGESQLDERIADLEVLSNPTVGLAAHSGVVDIRITAKARSESEADEMIWAIEATLRQRLGKLIFGADEETLSGVVGRGLVHRGLKLAVVESGTGGSLTAAVIGEAQAFAGGEVLPEDQFEALTEELEKTRRSKSADAGLGLGIRAAGSGSEICIVVSLAGKVKQAVRGYGGPPASAARWGTNLALNSLRIRLEEHQGTFGPFGRAP